MRRFTIVGVDEADASRGFIAFTAPIARTIQGKRAGDMVSLRTVQGEEILEITAIRHEIEQKRTSRNYGLTQTTANEP